MNSYDQIVARYKRAVTQASDDVALVNSLKKDRDELVRRTARAMAKLQEMRRASDRDEAREARQTDIVLMHVPMNLLDTFLDRLDASAEAV